MQRLILTSALALAVAVPATAGAKGTDVRVSGTCSASSSAKLKVSPDNGRIETEFEVDQNRNGRRWKVTLRRNGAVALRTTRTTRAPSGSFSVNRLLPDGSGRDTITARAVAIGTGEVCTASVTV